MNTGFTLRPATEADLPFLVEAIVAAEKSGTERLSYCTLFGLGEPELRTMLAAMLEEDLPGQELCISGFLLAERDGEPAGAANGWVEGTGSRASAIVKANLLAHFVGRERISAAAPRLALIEPLVVAREPGALQIESVYVAPGFRRQGVCEHIVAALEQRALAAPKPPAKGQIIVAAANEGALRVYRRCGYAEALRRGTADPAVAALLPATERVLLERRFAG